MAPSNRSHVHTAKPVIVKSITGECTPDRLPISSLTVRALGTKDRHSKVRTAKGLRDRRVRLSVSTAIEFFEVQDRLGFDQPSKALDWLIRHARAAIDELAPLERISIQNGSEETRAMDCIGQVANASRGTDAVHHEIPKVCEERQLTGNSCFGSDLSSSNLSQNGTSETSSKSDRICQVKAPTLTKLSTSHAHVPVNRLVLYESKQSISQYPSSTLSSSGTNCGQYMNSNLLQESCCSLHLSCNAYSPFILHDFSQQLSRGTSVLGPQYESIYYPTSTSQRDTLLSNASDGFTNFSILHTEGTPNSELCAWLDLH